MTNVDKLCRFAPGTVGVDRSASLANSAVELYSAGYRFATRTVGYAGYTLDLLTTAEVQSLQAAGLAIGISQAIRYKGWSKKQGEEDGAEAVKQAKALGAPTGMTLWFDLEAETCDATTLMAHINAWAAAVSAGGFSPGLYNGPQSVLTGAQISSFAGIEAYWRAAVSVADIGSFRGYQILQLYPGNIKVAGTNVDVDVIQEDYQGDYAQFWKAPVA